MMRFDPLGLEEWFHRWRGVGTVLDVSGAPFPEDFHPEVNDHLDVIELEDELLGVVSSLYGVERERVTLTFGTQNANYLVLMTQLKKEDVLAMENPIYEPMRVVGERVCSTTDIPRRMEDHYRIDLEELDGALSSGARMVMITNIHNPSGASLSEEEMRAVLEKAEDRDAMVLCDEIYREMSYSESPRGAYEIADNGISTNGMTKLYGLGDLRVGWVIGPEDVARSVELARLALLSHLPAHSLAVTIQALNRREWFRTRVLDRAQENLKILNDWARRDTRFSFMMPEGALMFLLPLPKGIDDMKFSELLLGKFDTAVCPGRYFGSLGEIRVTFSCPPEEFQRGLENISEALSYLS